MKKRGEGHMKIEEILLTGFRGTSSEMLVRKADSKFLILPNDKAKDAQMNILLQFPVLECAGLSAQS